MLVTLEFCNTYRLANHNLDATAHWCSDLNVSGLSIKRGLTTDSANVDISRTTLELMATELIYLVPEVPVKLSFYDNLTETFILALDGYVSKTVNKTIDIVTLTIESKVSYYFKQYFVPNLDATCQNQVYSKMCGLNKDNFKASKVSTAIDCMTGAMDYTTDLQTAFGDIDNLYLAHVVLDTHFKTRVVNVDRINNKLYLAMSFYDKVITANIDIYLYCNKTYGMCYSRFNNVKSFYGFPSIGQSVKLFNIFSATNISYCGEDIASLPAEACDSDNNLFGVTI